MNDQRLGSGLIALSGDVARTLLYSILILIVLPARIATRASAETQRLRLEQKAAATGDVFDFHLLERNVREHGIDAVIDEINATIGETEDRRLVTTLDHLREGLRKHPDQLWFQLYSHTRLKGWEDFQQQLEAFRPAEMLVVKTSLLTHPLPGVLKTWKFEKHPVSHLRMSADGSELFCGASTKEFVVIDPRSRKIIRRIPVNGRILTTLPQRDGKEIVVVWTGGQSGTSVSLNLRDTQSGEIIASLKDSLRFGHGGYGGVQLTPPMQLSPDGKHIIFWNGSAFVDRELSDLENVFRFRSRTEPSANPLYLEFLDATRLISLDDAGYVRTFDYPGGKELFPPRRIIHHTGCFAISPDRSRIACSGLVPSEPPQQIRPGTTRQEYHEIILVWEISNRKEITRFRPRSVPGAKPPLRISAMSFHDNGTLITGNTVGQVQQWKTTSPDPVTTVTPHRSPVLNVVPSQDGKRVFTSDRSGSVRLVNLQSTQKWDKPLPKNRTRSFRRYASWDGQWEAGMSGNKVTVWDADSDRRIHNLEIPTSLLRDFGTVTSIGIDLNKELLILGGEEKIGRWNFSSNEVQTVDVDVSGVPRIRRRGMTPPLPVYVSPDGRHAATWQTQHLVGIDVNTGKQKCLFSPGCYFGGVHHFLSGGRLAVTSRIASKNGVHVFDLNEGKEVANHIHGFRQYGVAHADRAGLILTGGKREQRAENEPDTLAVWKPGSPAEFIDLPDGVGVYKIGVNREGSRTITVSYDGILLLWDLTQHKILRRFDLGVKIHALAFDGHTLVITEHDRKTRHIFDYVANAEE